jgi:two-component system CheB/CheR fusion protein
MLTREFVSIVLDSAPDAMVIADASGSIVFANRQVSELLGYEPAEIIGAPIERLLPDRFRSGHAEHRRHFHAQPRTRPMGAGLELYARRKDGGEVPVEISLSPVTDADGVALVVAAIRDVTEQHAIRRKLREAQAEAERATQAKSRFLATASHDLRQPLQTLALLNGAMRRMSKDETLAEALGQGEQAIAIMSRLLNALLDISKLESGSVQPEIEDFEVATLFEELRAEFTGPAASKGLRLVIEACAASVHSDPALIGQVLRNLVSNAVKYTRAGTVSLRCTCDAAGMRFEVRDTGIGIPPGELNRIFDDFYQVGVPGGAPRQGYGLGLGIVSRIVNLLGLRLDVRSEVGEGTVFTLQLPAASVPARAAGDGGQARDRPQRGWDGPMHILLVEDDAGVRNATRMLLSVEGYEVSTAASRAEALRQAAEHPDIRLVVSDYHLGGQETGVEVVSAVRGTLGPDLGAILVTGDTSSAMRALARDTRMRAASKPVNADELLSLVRELATH